MRTGASTRRTTAGTFWRQTAFNYDVLNHTDLSRYSGKTGDINLATVNWGNYDLVVIDESHNFRNNNPLQEQGHPV